MKKITFELVIREEDADYFSKEFSKSLFLDECLFVLNIGNVEDLTKKEKAFVLSQLPYDIAKEYDNEEV